VSPKSRVGSFGWNTANHVALYFRAPCTGRVLHTMNIRLSAEQLIYTADHAEDEVVFVDRSLLPLFGQYLPKLNTVNHVIVFEDGSTAEYPHDSRLVSWNDAVGEECDFYGMVTDENTASAICYTTGNCAWLCPGCCVPFVYLLCTWASAWRTGASSSAADRRLRSAGSWNDPAAGPAQIIHYCARPHLVIGRLWGRPSLCGHMAACLSRWAR
jgi:acyl-CoA synthetase (AMP-forming)/AMP-acid ligase II